MKKNIKDLILERINEAKDEDFEGVEIQLYVLPLLNSTKLGVLTSKEGIQVLSEAGKWSYVSSEKGNGWIITSKIKGQEQKHYKMLKNVQLKIYDQIQRLIRQATSHENLSQSYLGWCPFW